MVSPFWLVSVPLTELKLEYAMEASVISSRKFKTPPETLQLASEMGLESLQLVPRAGTGTKTLTKWLDSEKGLENGGTEG